jgi:hypothetical protein
VQAVRASWSSGSFLLYAGGIGIALALLLLLGLLGTDQGNGAFVAWSLLVFLAAAALTFVARQAGWSLAAGLFGLSAMLGGIAFVGSLESWFGWLATTEGPFDGFHLGNLLLAVVAVGAGLIAIRLLRFPLLVLPTTLAAWFFVTDLISNGGDWSTTVTLFVGFALSFVALAVERSYGFWIHVVAGILIGGAVLTFWHASDAEWLLVVLVSLGFVAVATILERSSYAVLGAIGLLLATTHFALRWFVPPISFFSRRQPAAAHPYLVVFMYVGYGLALMGIGTLQLRRRDPSALT